MGRVGDVGVLVGRRFLALAGVVSDQVHLELFGGDIAQGQPARVDAFAAEMVDDAGTAVLGARGRLQVPEAARAVHADIVEDVHVAVGVLARERGVEEQLVGHDHAVPGRADVHAVEAAVAGFDVAGVGAGGLLGDQAHSAADGVLAEQRALRAPNDFDAVEVQQVEDRALWAAVVDTVDIDRHAGLERQDVVAQAHAPDEGGKGGAPACAEGADHRIGHRAGQVGDVGLAHGFDLLAGDGADRQRSLLQLGGAELGGHHHLAHLGPGGVGGDRTVGGQGRA